MGKEVVIVSASISEITRNRWLNLFSSCCCLIVASYLQTQRSAIKMLHERIKVLVDYVSGVVAGNVYTSCYDSCLTNGPISKGSAKKDHEVLRSLTALVASLPASEHPAFRDEFDTVLGNLFMTHCALKFTPHTIICLGIR